MRSCVASFMGKARLDGMPNEDFGIFFLALVDRSPTDQISTVVDATPSSPATVGRPLGDEKDGGRVQSHRESNPREGGNGRLVSLITLHAP